MTALPWPKSIWVIVRNNGYEGFDIPSMAFSTQEEAELALKIPVDWAGMEIKEIPFWTPNGDAP